MTPQDVEKIVKKYLQSTGFTTRKITDTPTDDFQVTPRKYVNMNGITANRPTSSVVGQFYYDTTLQRPIWWTGSTFKDAAGNVV